jgi:hypothetical protein
LPILQARDACRDVPILPSSVRRPASPVPRNYVPPQGHKYKVGNNDSWVSLAATAGIPPWDLIRYNYPGLPADLQQAAREVNWYLQEYVGCTTVTPDSRNYVFSSTASPGEIWIPNPIAPVTRTPDQIARDRVLATLREPIDSNLNFGVGRLFIPASQYEWVAKAIEGGYISVREDSNLTGSAVYHWDVNRIDVPAYGGPPNVGQRALIIHECTHAIVDLRKITTRVEETEGLAYVAQALYSNLNGMTARHIVSADPHDIVSWFSWQLIFDESTRLADVVKRRYRVTEDEASVLYTAIKGANFYRRRVGNAEVNDGVADQFYLSP